MRRNSFFRLCFIILMAAVLSLGGEEAMAVPAAPITYTLVQPDGTKFKARVRGDEWNNWTATIDGYPILKEGASGYWVYAQSDSEGKLKKSSFKVGIDVPIGIQKGLIPKSRAINPNSFSHSPFSGRRTILQAPPVPGSGNHPVLVILVNFSDITLTTAEAEWADRFFAATASVADYYDEVSYGNLSMIPAAESYGTADNGIVVVSVGYAHPDTRGDYNNDANRQLTRDALVAADFYVDFSSFDSDSSGGLSPNELHVVVVAAGYSTAYGGELLACSPSLWPHWADLGWTSVPAPILDGIRVASYADFGGYVLIAELQAEIITGCGTGSDYMSTIGTTVHELGHDLGLPDEYDIDSSSSGIGYWGVMAGGSSNYVGSQRLGESPAHPTAWDKWYLGWLTPIQITGSTTVSISQVETSATVYQLLDNPGGVDWSSGRWGFTGMPGTGEYFLVENRQATGYDAGLPGCGILIWHIDESAPHVGNGANWNEWGRRLIALEQADGLFDLENGTNHGDSGDPYISGGGFADDTTPDSKLYDGTTSGVSVTVNDACGANMSVTLNGGTLTPTTYYANESCGDDSNTGTSPICGGADGPKATIQTAIDVTSYGDTIIVADGTYTENINFLGKAITIQSENGPDVTVIDGNGTGSVVEFGSNEGYDSVLDGFRITGGSGLVDGSNTYGGGIVCHEFSSPLVTNCIINNNTAKYGGGIYGDTSWLMITNCTISSNSAAEYGGGILAAYSLLIITDCTISSNSAGTNGGGIFCNVGGPAIINCDINNNTADSGGGVFCLLSSPAIINCTISSNTATQGGGIFCFSASPRIDNCTISNNKNAVEGGGIWSYDSLSLITSCTINNNSASNIGGGVFCYNSLPSFTNCTISNNTAGWGGGIYCQWESSLKITNCTISSNTANYSGGGVYCYENSSPTITNCTINANSADYGGGIYCSTSSPTISDCTISSNTANYGGGIYCYDTSSPTITNCTVSNNTADNSGAGIFCYTSSPTISDCTISSNTAGWGGGIYCYDTSSPTITNCTVSNNTADNNGAGIYCYTSSPTITDCTVSSNTANYGGGIYCYENSSPTITNCTINANSASGGSGGGIRCSVSSSPTITNCTISSNSATTDGGGLACYYSSSPKITNCTISEGSAGGSGGGIYSYSSSPIVVNTILWGGTASGDGDEIYGSINITYSDIQGGWGGTGNINSDPQFVAGNEYHLQPGSPCIDRGTDDSATYPTLPSDDIDGDPRPYDVLSVPNNPSAYDMGSDEYVGGCTDTDADGVCDDVDNCTLVPNTDQCDTDGDGYGNMCDPDLNNDCYVTSADLPFFSAAFFSCEGDPNFNPDADLNCDGCITSADLPILSAHFFGSPGPGLGSCN